MVFGFPPVVTGVAAAGGPTKPVSPRGEPTGGPVMSVRAKSIARDRTGSEGPCGRC